MAESEEKITCIEKAKTVVIAMDGSEQALHALQWYAEHAHRPSDKVVMVYCVEMSDVLSSSQWLQAPHNYNPDHDAYKTLLEHEIKKVQARLEEFAAHMQKLNINGIVKSTHASKPGEGILNVAHDMKAGLVITGSRGLGKIRRTLLGSVSDYLVHHSHVPVLVCRYQDKG